MPKYLLRSQFTTEGMKGLMKEGGTARREAVERTIQSLGGRFESMHWAFGENDTYIIADMPSNVSAATMGMAISATGAVRVNTVVLLTPEEIDEAVRQKTEYRAPGA